MEIANLHAVATAEPVAELDRLGDEIAELSAHLDAATAHLLELIREFDARGGWNHGFRSCAHWLSWRVGMALGAAREHVRVARALGSLPRLAEALGRGERRRPRSSCWPAARPAPRVTSSASSVAGGASTGWLRPARRLAVTRRVRCRCIKTKTVWSWFADA